MARRPLTRIERLAAAHHALLQAQQQLQLVDLRKAPVRVRPGIRTARAQVNDGLQTLERAITTEEPGGTT